MNNGRSGGGGENEEDFSGAGQWAYMGQASAYDPYNSSMAYSVPGTFNSNQASVSQTRAHHPSTQSTYPSPPPPQNNTPYYVSQSKSSVAQTAPSYADVVSRGNQARAKSAYEASQRRQPPQTQQQAITPQRVQPSMMQSSGTPNSFQVPPQQSQARSWAQVAANGQRQMFYANPQGRTTNHALSGHPQSLRQYGYARMDQLMHTTLHPYAAQGLDSFDNWVNSVAQGNAGNGNQVPDFTLYDDPLDRYLEQPEPFVAPGSLVVDTSSTMSPSQLLKSPADSMDTSSVASSRRSKREILSGNSGAHKCPRCGAGFNTFEDARHHEYRVHLPYSARPFPCSQCDRRFVFKKDLTRHEPRHGDRSANAKFWCPFTDCKYATDGFARKDHYRRHVATHYKVDSAVQMSRSTSAGTFS